MMRAIVTLMALLAVSTAGPALAATKAKPKAQTPQTSSVAAVVTRAGAAGETMQLRDLNAFDAQTRAGDRPNDWPDDWTAYAEQRAAIRACHAERYATARDNVLSGRSAPLRDC